jgi:3-hydroxybutyryl-CoA dehydrogenase
MAQASREIYPSLTHTDHLATCITDLMAQGRTGMKAGAGFVNWTTEQIAEERKNYDARLKAAFKILSMK